MRWIWIDRILELERGVRCVAVKNVSAAEEVVHDQFRATTHYRATPLLPHPLIIEGMAQTAGILVGHANDFREKVLLAKIGKARFTAVAPPGYALQYEARVEQLAPSGASTSGRVVRIDPVTGERVDLAEIDLLFSHADQNLAGFAFPEHNFVFTEQFMDLLRQSGFEPPPGM